MRAQQPARRSQNIKRRRVRDNSSGRPPPSPQGPALLPNAVHGEQRCGERAKRVPTAHAPLLPSPFAAVGFAPCPPFEQAQGRDDNPHPIPTCTARCNAFARPRTVQMAKVGSNHRASAHLLDPATEIPGVIHAVLVVPALFDFALPRTSLAPPSPPREQGAALWRCAKKTLMVFLMGTSKTPPGSLENWALPCV